MAANDELKKEVAAVANPSYYTFAMRCAVLTSAVLRRRVQGISRRTHSVVCGTGLAVGVRTRSAKCEREKQRRDASSMDREGGTCGADKAGTRQKRCDARS
eukprot:2487682-Rhodomonas_salina.2